MDEFKEKYNSSTDDKTLKGLLKCIKNGSDKTKLTTEKKYYIESLLNLAEKQDLKTVKIPNAEKQEKAAIPYEVQIAKKYNQLYESAMKRKKDFNLTLKDVHYLLQEKKCYYTDELFTKNGDFKRTIDRVDNAKGYIRGNVVACTMLANQMKEHIFERPTNNTSANIQFISSVAKKVLTHLK